VRKPLLSPRRGPLPPPLVLLLAILATACGSDGADIQAPVPVASVRVTAPADSVLVGDSLQLTATALDSAGTALEARTFDWSTDDTSLASVSASGLVAGLAPGNVVIHATSEGVIGSLTITVSPAPTTPPPPPGGPTDVGLQEIASGLSFPLYLASPPGDERLFVVEKTGAIRVVKDGTLLPTPFLDLSAQVSGRAEQGLLGLAFPPDFASSGRFFVDYTDLEGDTHVSAFRVSSDPDRADPASESVVLAIDQPGPSHNGGQLLFGPDGMLYIGMGDGGSHGGDDHGRGQSLDDLLGSILRIDVSSGTSYTVPPDNPFVGTAGARGEIWNYGLRNPWRFSFDRGTGDIYIADVGETQWEEVNYSAAADGAGRKVDYGWNVMEGRHCLGTPDCDQSGLTLPVLEYSHDMGCAIIGGYVYRGSAIPALQGHYFYSDFCQGWVRSFRIEDDQAVEEADWPSLAPGGQVSSFGEDAEGELYVLTGDGRVLKIVAR
jgi:glucose/arabinose dehydrogenase